MIAQEHDNKKGAGRVSLPSRDVERFIDAVIVPALLERLRREHPLQPKAA